MNCARSCFALYCCRREGTFTSGSTSRFRSLPDPHPEQEPERELWPKQTQANNSTQWWSQWKKSEQNSSEVVALSGPMLSQVSPLSRVLRRRKQPKSLFAPTVICSAASSFSSGLRLEPTQDQKWPRESFSGFLFQMRARQARQARQARTKLFLLFFSYLV